MATGGDGTLCITEKWIRDRLNLRIDSLDVVRSLSLPGSYEDKRITHLGRSLLGFTHLKHLDLSRNAVESLQGLDHLKQLETLNLYYNNIASLKELFRLRHNSKLKELDLRLNPVTKNEPDYRLFVIHMLVNLRKLDNRSVRDSERKAAIRHFDSDQAHKFEHSKNSGKEDDSNNKVNHIHSRRRLVQSLASRPTALEDDTDELLELIGKSDKFLTPTKHHGHTPRLLVKKGLGSSPFGARLYSSESHSGSDTDFNKSTVEAEARTELKVKGNFTPAPVVKQPHHPQPVDSAQPNVPPALKELVQLIQGYVDGDMSSLELDSTFRGKFEGWLGRHSTPRASPSRGRNRVPTEELEKHLDTLQQQLQHKQILVEQLQAELSQSKCESNMLGERLKAQESRLEELRQHEGSRDEIHHLLQQANKDMASLQQHMKSVQEENTLLKKTIDQTPSHLDELHRQVCDLEREKDHLQLELTNASERHEEDVNNVSNIQELARMLQESHRSLVETNDHLLQELEETKQRHYQDIMQMNSNYEHLKKTVHLMQHT